MLYIRCGSPPPATQAARLVIAKPAMAVGRPGWAGTRQSRV